MKISKVKHTRAAVSKPSQGQKQQNSQIDVEGVLYQVPGQGTMNIEGRLSSLEGTAKILYNIFSPIQAGTKPEAPEMPEPNQGNAQDYEEQLKRYERKEANYQVKIANYNRREKYGNLIRIANEIANRCLFETVFNERSHKKHKFVVEKDVFFRSVSRREDRVDYELKDALRNDDLRTFVSMALRKSLKEQTEGVICFYENLGNKNISAEDKKKLLDFLEAVRNDYNRVSNAKDKIVRSIQNQNMVMQAKGERFAMPVPPAADKKTAKKNAKAFEKEGINRFLIAYADLDEAERMGMLRKLRRILDVYFAVPENTDKAQDVSLPDDFAADDFDVWQRHSDGKKVEGNYVAIPDILSDEADGKAVDQYKRNLALEAVRNNIRTKNIQGYHYALACTKQFPEHFFEDEAVNQFWVHHIESAIERILLNGSNDRLKANNYYKLKNAYLKERLWKDMLNYISIKFIALGKIVYHFGLSELESENTEITLGKVDAKVKHGVTSFDYEMIKAGEELQREMAVHVAYATNNLARATVNTSEGNEDFLLMKQDALSENRKYIDDEDLKKMILQFFGGRSSWKEDPFKNIEAVDVLLKVKDCLYSLRNESFHFTTKNGSIESSDIHKNLIANMFREEAGRCTAIDKEKFYSNNLPMFYSSENLRKVLDQLYSGVSERASQVPAYNNMIARKNFPDFLKNSLGYTEPGMGEELKSKWYHACYFLFKEIYYNGFLQDAGSLKRVKNAIERLPYNKENERAVVDFRKRCLNEIKVSSVSELCQIIMTEYNYQNNQNRKVRAASAFSFDREIFQHYKMLLYLSLRMAFADYINSCKVYGFLKNPKTDGKIVPLDQFLPDWSSNAYGKLVNTVASNPELQKWYVLGRLLNGKSLSHLVGTVRSYIQYVEDVKKRAGYANTSLQMEEYKDVSEMKRVANVLDICIKLSARTSNNVEDYFRDSDEYAEYLKNYLDYAKYEHKDLSPTAALKMFCNDEEKHQRLGIYMDGENPIVNKNIVMAKLYGPEQILQKILPKVTESDILEYYEKEKTIANAQLQSANPTENSVKEVRAFQQLKNRIEFRDVVEYGELINALHGQLVNWSYMRERDLLYFQLGFHYACLNNKQCEKPDGYDVITCGDHTVKGAILHQVMGLYINGIGIYQRVKNSEAYEEQGANISAGGKIGKFLSYASKTLGYTGGEAEKFYYAGMEVFENINEHDNIVNVRNQIDHFHYYLGGGETGSLLKLYSEVFDRFFTYDMKYQKNVLNILQNILLKQYFVILEPELRTAKKIVGEKEAAYEKESASIWIRRISSDQFTYKSDKESLKMDAKDASFLENVAKILCYPEEYSGKVEVHKAKTEENEDNKAKKQGRNNNRSDKKQNNRQGGRSYSDSQPDGEKFIYNPFAAISLDDNGGKKNEPKFAKNKKRK